MSKLSRQMFATLAGTQKPEVSQFKNLKFKAPIISGQRTTWMVSSNTDVFYQDAQIAKPLITVPALKKDLNFDVRILMRDLEIDSVAPLAPFEIEPFEAVSTEAPFPLDPVPSEPSETAIPETPFAPDHFVIDLAEITDETPELLGECAVFGQRYAEKPVTAKLPDKRKSFTDEDAVLTVEAMERALEQRGSMWDIVYVLLRPPITLDKPEELAIPYPLRNYQRQGIEFLINNERALLADDMGTGKKVMSIIALKTQIQRSVARKALVLCSSSTLREWRLHLSEWARELVTVNVQGTPEQRLTYWQSPAHVYLTTYELMGDDLDTKNFPGSATEVFDIIVLDEAHLIKSLNSNRVRAVGGLKAKQRWVLRSTPPQTKLEDFLPMFDFLRTGLLSSMDVRSAKVMEKIKPYILRRKKQDVLRELPPKQIQELWIELEEDERLSYSATERGALNELQGLNQQFTKDMVLAKINLLKQLCNFAPERRTSTKLEVLAERVEAIVASGNKVVIFNEYTEQSMEKIERVLQPYRPAKLTKDMTDDVRTRELDRFRRSFECSVMIIANNALENKINIGEVSYIFHFDHWWNPSKMTTLEDWVIPTGSKGGVNVYSMWTHNTIEERLYNLLEKRNLIVRGVFNSGLSEDQTATLISREDWLSVLGEASS